jgi:uracil-DNA glycosylase
MLKQPCWSDALGVEFKKPYMQDLMTFLAAEELAGKVIFPSRDRWFAALDETPLKNLAVVILGQDPYPTPGHAHGLSFSVQRGVGIPRSLRNIYRELESDLGIAPASHGCLEAWAAQGVLLLNDTLTVESGQAGAHQKKGWSEFTDRIIDTINEQCEQVVFMLWGAHAQKKGVRIDRGRHLVLESVHPSPLSARRGFFGCKHFSKANEYLKSHGKSPVDWSLN